MRRSWMRPVAFALALALAGPLTAGCYGKFALTKKIYDWNGSLGNKFVVSLVMFIFFVVPVYAIAGFVDWILINVIEFWTGNNPAAWNETETQERLVERDDGTKVKMTLSDRGATMRVEIAAPGQEVKVMVLHRTADGLEASDASGAVVASASFEGSGALRVRDAAGRVMEEKNAGQVEALTAAAERGTGSLLVAFEAQKALSGARLATAR